MEEDAKDTADKAYADYAKTVDEAVAEEKDMLKEYRTRLEEEKVKELRQDM